MKNQKFLEQLNLYLDGEIDPAGAAELEQEIISNPARRRIYQDYCRIHRATKLVYEHFRAAGAANETGPLPSISTGETGADLIALSRRTGGRAPLRPFRRAAFVGGLAAACAVGVFIGTQALAPRAPEALAPAPALAVAEPAPAETVVTVEAAAVQPATFPAPFAPEVRSDPFVQRTPARGDPFALTPWTVVDEAHQPSPSLSNPPMLKIDPRFRPASFDKTAEPQNAGEARPFRLRVNSPSTASSAPASP